MWIVQKDKTIPTCFTRRVYNIHQQWQRYLSFYIFYRDNIFEEKNESDCLRVLSL